MAYQLIFTKGPDEGRAVELQENQTLAVGRGEDTELIVHDLHVSRSHCRIEVREGCVVLFDIGSSFGTYVNGKAITEHELRHGDVVTLGETQVHFYNAVDLQVTTLFPVAASPAKVPKVPEEFSQLKSSLVTPIAKAKPPGTNLGISCSAYRRGAHYGSAATLAGPAFPIVWQSVRSCV